MLTCITCSSKEEDDGGAAAARGSGTAGSKEAVKSLTTQIKDIALKFSGACKPCTGSSSFRKGLRPYPDLDAISEGTPYPFTGGSTSSTPAWDFPTSRGVAARSVMALDDENEPKEWMAQVEPGVHIAFLALPDGGNDLKRIRFSREMFDKWQAQRWWGENYDRIMELYNVRRFDRQGLNTLTRSEDARGETPSMEASRTTTSSSVSISNASEMESEWVEQDEPGVYITIRQLADGARELRRVRFSREKFGEMNAKQWWAENRERIQEQYL